MLQWALVKSGKTTTTTTTRIKPQLSWGVKPRTVLAARIRELGV